MDPAAEPVMIMIDTKHEKKSSAMHELAMLLTQVGGTSRCFASVSIDVL